MKQKSTRFLLALLAGTSLVILLCALSAIVMEIINAGFGFAIWLGAFTSCVSCTYLAGGLRTKKQKGSGGRDC